MKGKTILNNTHTLRIDFSCFVFFLFGYLHNFFQHVLLYFLLQHCGKWVNGKVLEVVVAPFFYLFLSLYILLLNWCNWKKFNKISCVFVVMFPKLLGFEVKYLFTQAQKEREQEEVKGKRDQHYHCNYQSADFYYLDVG